MDERRKSSRTSVNLKVIYMGDSMNYSRGKVNNISKVGMFIQTEIPQDVGMYILASIDVDNMGRIVWAQGRVVRKSENGMGIEFTRTDTRGIDSIISNWGMPY
jgi:hypothetical protein